jgi:hypothetical protein
MKTALDIVSEACRTLGLTAPATLADKLNKQTQRMIGSLNRTAEDLTLTHNWLTQIRLKTFTLDRAGTIYNQQVQGYDLDEITGGDFERFTSSFLWNLTDKEKVDGITIDKFMASTQSPVLPGELTFMRMGKYLKFYPDDKDGIDIQFYYQTKNIAYKVMLPSNVEADTISEDLQIPYHNAKLLLRGILLNYSRNEGLDTNQFQDDFDKFLKKCIVDEAPAATIKFMQGYGEAYLGRFPFIGG